MAKDIKRHITHIKSKVVENNSAKLPAAADLEYGEIAVNYAKGHETLSIKNESGDVVTFNTNTFYGTCSTAAATKDKVVTLSNASGWRLKSGVIVGVNFSNTNTFSGGTNGYPTLNVNSSGAKYIWYNTTSANTGTNTTAYGYANRITYYMYDGTGWVWINQSVDNNTTYSTMSAAELSAGTKTTSRVMSAANLKTGGDAIWAAKSHTHDDRYYTESELTGSSTSVVVAKAASATTAEKVEVITQDPTSFTGYYVLFGGTGNPKSLSSNDGIRYFTQQGTSADTGSSILTLGNTISAGTEGNKEGELRILSSTNKYGKLKPSALSGNRTYTLPDKTGTVALIEDLTGDTSIVVDKAASATTAENANSAYTAENANSAYTSERVSVTSENPTATKTYQPIFGSTGSSDIKILKNNDGFKLTVLEGTESNNGYNYLTLGNSIPTGTTENKYGLLYLYSKGTYYTRFKPDDNITANRTFTLPDKSGTVALASDINSVYQEYTDIPPRDGGLYWYTVATYTYSVYSKNATISLSFYKSSATINVILYQTTEFYTTCNDIITSANAGGGGLDGNLRIIDKGDNVYDIQCGIYSPSGGTKYKYASVLVTAPDSSAWSVPSSLSADTTEYTTEIIHTNKFTTKYSSTMALRPNEASTYNIGTSTVPYKNVYANAFKGLADSASTAVTAVGVNITNINPSAQTTYWPTFVSGSGYGEELDVNNGFKYTTLQGTTTDTGISRLTLGNSTAAGTNGNKEGSISIYSSNDRYGILKMGDLSGSRTYTFPNKTGTVALTDDIIDTKVTQTITNTNSSFPVILKKSANNTAETDTANFASGVTINPSTNTITASKFNGTATYADAATELKTIATIGGQETTNYPWRRLASTQVFTTGANYRDIEALLVIRQTCYGGKTGILKITFRTNLIASQSSTGNAVWLVRNGFERDDVKIALYWTANSSYADVFLKAPAYPRMYVNAINNQGWTFYSSNEGTGGADPVNAYASIEAAATAIHGKAYTSSATSIDGGVCSNADTVDGYHATKFGFVYNSQNINNYQSASVNDMVNSGNSNVTFGMVNSATDNPLSAQSWVHVWSQQWAINNSNDWVSQIAVGTQNKNGMWYRATNSDSSIVGKPWIRLIDSNNISAQTVNYASYTGRFGVAPADPTTETTYYPIWTDSTNGQQVPHANDGLMYHTLQGTTSAVGKAILYLGNNKSSGTAGNKEGRLVLYSPTTKFGVLNCTSLSDNRSYTLPDKNGTVALTSDLTGINADKVDGWHLYDIKQDGYVTSSVSGLTSYWFKAWTITVTDKRYTDQDAVMLIESAYNRRAAIVLVKIRQQGANGSGAYNFDFSVQKISGNIPNDAVRLSVNNSTGVCDLWLNCVNQYGCYNVTILKKNNNRFGNDCTSLGTLATGDYSTAQSVPALSTTCKQMEGISQQVYELAAEGRVTLSGDSTAWHISSGPDNGLSISQGTGIAALVHLDFSDGGDATFMNDLAVQRSLTVGTSLTVEDNINCRKVLNGISSIEFRSMETTSGIGGWIDFHFNGSSTSDYSSRIAEYAAGVVTLEGSFISNGGITALSDAREKNVVDDVKLTVEQIAKMPAVAFEWKDSKRHDSLLHVGTLAQSWLPVLPQVIHHTHDDKLSFNYGVASLVSSIITARKVVDHEDEIKALKAKINTLEARISELER